MHIYILIYTVLYTLIYIYIYLFLKTPMILSKYVQRKS